MVTAAAAEKRYGGDARLVTEAMEKRDRGRGEEIEAADGFERGNGEAEVGAETWKLKARRDRETGPCGRVKCDRGGRRSGGLKGHFGRRDERCGRPGLRGLVAVRIRPPVV